MPASKKSRLKKPGNITSVIIALAIFIIVFGVLKVFSLPSSPPPTIPIKTETPKKNLTGMYKGTLPCADCSGIEETLTLAGTDSTSGTYILEDVYQGKSIPSFRTQGTWTIYNSNIKLTPSDKSQLSYFKILDNGDLQMIDPDMKEINSPFNQTLIRQN